MKTKLLCLAAAAIIPLVLASCDPGAYYGGYGGNYGSGYTSGYVSSLPYGYNTVYVGSRPYYYHNNTWYRRSSGRYYRCSRPHGYHGSIGRHSSHHSRRYLTRLPSGYRSHYYGGTRYYSHGGSWYQRRNGRYYRCAQPRSYRRSSHSSHRHSSSSRNRYDRSRYDRHSSHRSVSPHRGSGSRTIVRRTDRSHDVRNKPQVRRKPVTTTKTRRVETKRKETRKPSRDDLRRALRGR